MLARKPPPTPFVMRESPLAMRGSPAVISFLLAPLQWAAILRGHRPRTPYAPMHLQLGIDNYSLRSFGWNAAQLIEYAAALRLDVLMLSDLDVFGTRADTHLREIRARAADRGLALQVGMLSICPSSVMFDPRRGTAGEQLRETIRVAGAVGSPIARCVLGKVDDRRSPGGIGARIAETVAVLQSVRSFAQDRGIKVAVENHAGDLQSRELLGLIDAAGRDWVGALVDAGNATWALEEPLCNLARLAPVALTSGIRDSVLWPAPDGAVLQWAAVGEGSVDLKNYFAQFARLCPQVPVILETISGRPIPIPFRAPDFWTAYPPSDPREFAAFMAWIERGQPRPPFVPPAGPAGVLAEQEFQRAELERSVRYCREVLGLERGA